MRTRVTSNFREATPWHFNVGNFCVWQQVLLLSRSYRLARGRNPICRG